MPQPIRNSSSVFSECLLSYIWGSDYGSGTWMDGGYIALCFINSLTSLTSVGGNLLVVLAIWRTPVLHMPSYLLLGWLGVSDFLTGLVTQPAFVLLYTLRRTETFVHAYCFLKFIAGFSGIILVGNSFLVLTTIAIDKYLAIKLHLRYNELVTNSRTMITVSFLFAVLVLLCSVALASEFRASFIINVVAKAGGIFVACFAHISVYASVKRHKRQIFSQEHAAAVGNKLSLKRFEKSVNTSLYILASFLICFLPDLGVLIMMKLLGFGTPRVINFTFNLTLTILWANATINPILYCYRLRKIQRAVFKVLKDWFPCAVLFV